MSSALVIKQANFSENKLATVQLIDDIPCTGISLNKTSTTVGTTETLTATISPTNTTDVVTWSSSNSGIASVNNGVVTAVANGTAIITATCGSYSATCTVTVIMPMFSAKPGIIMVDVKNGTTLANRANVTYVTSIFASIGGASGDYIAAWKPNVANTDFEHLYPYKIPVGATTINVSMSNDISATVVFFNSKEHGDVIEEYETPALCLDGETLSSGTPWSIQTQVWGDRIIPVSSVSGVDSFVLGLAFKDQAAYDSYDTSNPGITITFGFDPVS